MTDHSIRTLIVAGATAIAASLSAVAGVSGAPTHAVDITNNNTNNGYDVGWAFTISAPITVTDLGKFVIGGTAADSEVGIYQDLGGSAGGSGALLVSGIVPANAPQEASGTVNAQYVSIAPVTLPAGSYVVFGRQQTELFAEHATGTYGPGITFVAGVATTGQSTDPLPATEPNWSVYNTGPDRYFGPTFEYTTPEPGSLGLLGLGATGLLARRRRKH